MVRTVDDSISDRLGAVRVGRSDKYRRRYTFCPCGQHIVGGTAMNRTLMFGIAVFFAVLGIALMGGENQAVAGHGCHGGLFGGRCHGGGLFAGHGCRGNGGLFARRCRGGGADCGGAVVTDCGGGPGCAGAVDCGGRSRCHGGLLARLRARRAARCHGGADCGGAPPACCGAPAPPPTCCGTPATVVHEAAPAEAPVEDVVPEAPAAPEAE